MLFKNREFIGSVILGFCFCLGLISIPPAANAKPPKGKAWALVWADEFDGAEIDTTKWNYFDGWGLSPWREAYYTEEDAFLENGNLVIRSRKDGDQYKTAGLTSHEKFEHRYGYYEISARMSGLEALGQWVAFWLYIDGYKAHDGNAANGVEVDIIEYFVQRENIYHAVHWGIDWSQNRSHTSTIPGLRKDFHTFGIEWSPEMYIFYIDDKEVWRVTKGVSQVKQWILLTLEIQTVFLDDVYNISDYSDLLPDYWVVDYVRVYDLVKIPPPWMPLLLKDP